MADERPLTRIVHGVGQVARQNDLETELRHLADSEGAVENTDIGVDAHQSDVGNAFLLAEVIDLLTVVADAVKTGDVDGGMLAGPRIRAGPFLQDRVIAAALGVINGKFARLN